jgi:photosystem II stability/assembly factor-like uncharacterized protein
MKSKPFRVAAIILAILLVSLACLPTTPSATIPPRTATPSEPPTFASTDTLAEPPPIPAGAGEPQPAAAPHFSAGERIELTEIRMITTDEGWGLSGPYVLVTADGGDSWQEFTPPQVLADPEAATAYAAFLDARTAWVIYAENDQIPYDASVWSTADGGRTWRPSAPLMHEAYGDVVWAELAAYGTDDGWLMMRGAYAGAGAHYAMQLLHSTDGGLTWMSLPGADVGVDYTSLAFASPGSGWLAWQTTGAYGPGAPEYAVTADGGISWEPRTLPPPAEAPTLFDDYEYSEPYQVNVLSADSVRLLVGVYGYGYPPAEFASYLYSTEDGGSSWQAAPLPAGVFARDYSLICFDANSALLLGRESYKTSDGGESWQHVSTVFWDGQYSFVDPLHGWAAGQMGGETALVRTADGGAHWEIVTAVIAP